MLGSPSYKYSLEQTRPLIVSIQKEVGILKCIADEPLKDDQNHFDIEICSVPLFQKYIQLPSGISQIQFNFIQGHSTSNHIMPHHEEFPEIDPIPKSD